MLKRTFIVTFLSFLFLTSCGQEMEVKKACKEYMSARIALRFGDSTKLKKITVDSLYTLLMLNHKYLGLLKDVPTFRADLNIEPKEIEIYGNKASCLMNGSEYYKIHLRKENGKWVVEGENEQFNFRKSIAEVKKRTADYNAFLKDKPARDSVLKVLGSFFSGIELYFTKQDLSVLTPISSESTLKVIILIHKHAISRTGEEIILKELKKPKYNSKDVIFGREQVVCKFYNDEPEIIFQKGIMNTSL